MTDPDILARSTASGVASSGGRQRASKALHAPALLALIAAVGVTAARPPSGNQVQYLFYAYLDRNPELQADPLAVAPDPYPLFTALSEGALRVGGIAVVALLSTVLVFIASLALLRLVDRAGGGPLAGWLTVAAVVITPHVLQVPNVWDGLGGQYVLAREHFLQPSSFGVLLFVWLCREWSVAQGAPRDLRWDGPAALAAAAAVVFHPTYLSAFAAILAAAAAADVVTRQGLRPTLWRGGAFALGLAASLAANPGVLSTASSGGAAQAALERFAFERIAGHTLVQNWEATDLLILLGPLAIVLIAWRRQWFERAGWTAAFIAVITLACAITALWVQATHSTFVALAFPWRVSVCITPLAVGLLMAGIDKETRAVRWARHRVVLPAVVAIACLVAALGAATTVKDLIEPAPLSASAALARELPADGVGLAPVYDDDVRLAAPRAVWVDWKSPPYVGDALVQWWARIDAARAAYQEPGGVCRLAQREGLRWFIARDAGVDDCTGFELIARRGELAGWAAALR